MEELDSTEKVLDSVSTGFHTQLVVSHVVTAYNPLGRVLGHMVCGGACSCILSRFSSVF